jgi:hypothetical protein
LYLFDAGFGLREGTYIVAEIIGSGADFVEAVGVAVDSLVVAVSFSVHVVVPLICSLC